MKYINLEYHPADSRVRIVDDDVSQTLSSRMGTGGATCQLYLKLQKMKQITLTEKRFFQWHEDDVSVTLRNRSGSYGGERSTRHILYTDTVGAICASDYKGAGNQYVYEGKLVIEVHRNDCGSSDS